MKKAARKIVAAILGYQVKQLYKKNDFKVIGVVGSIGKTSTKLAIAKTLETKFRVRYQEGNYNDLVSVPLVFFDQNIPSLFNPLSWLAVFWRNQQKITKPYPYDYVVLELGSDAPGQIAEFKNYLKLEIALVTAITPEHMEFFKDLDQVAKEELAVSKMSTLVLLNKDLCDEKYLKELGDYLTYSIKEKADYTPSMFDIKNDITVPEQYSRLAAGAVGLKFGMSEAEIKSALKQISPFSGRMQKLKGIKESVIFDDSYNASPDAVKLALDTLYSVDAPQKIALLGNMNELGEYSKQAHIEIGDYCDPKKLDLVVTLGPDANKYLAAEAKKKGCTVHSFESPYRAGEFIKEQIKPKAAILVKGSQNKVFAEEAIKSFLANPLDQTKLVRQSKQWSDVKKKAFQS